MVNMAGQVGSGKTTLTKELEKLVKSPIIIDGDELREIFSNKDYSEVGRLANITTGIKLSSKYLFDYNFHRVNHEISQLDINVFDLSQIINSI